MNAQDFAYWLQGFVELTNTPQPSEAQWQAIKDHLQLVFKKETPQYNIPRVGDGMPRAPQINPWLDLPDQPLTMTC